MARPTTYVTGLPATLMEKACTICGEVLDIEKFQLEPAMRSGRRNQCTECLKKRKLDAYYGNREAILKRKRLEYAANPEPERERALASYHKNRESNLAYKRKYRAKNPEKYREWNTRRRARRLGNEAEAYSREDIFERDGWVCGVCHQPVDRLLQWPDPNSRSIDHVVALSNGGPDTADNVQLAHLSCNISKHSKE